MRKRKADGKGLINRRKFLKWAGEMGLALPFATAPFANLKRANAAEEKTLTVAWDTEIDTLDPASFKWRSKKSLNGAFARLGSRPAIPLCMKTKACRRLFPTSAPRHSMRWFPPLFTLKYGRRFPWESERGVARISCSDSKNPVVFKITLME